MAFAATEVKKKEKTSVRSSPTSTTLSEVCRYPKNTPIPTAVSTTPTSIAIREMSWSVRSPAAASPARNALRAMPQEPDTILRDFTMPKIPAVAMAPTPTKRT